MVKIRWTDYIISSKVRRERNYMKEDIKGKKTDEIKPTWRSI